MLRPVDPTRTYTTLGEALPAVLAGLTRRPRAGRAGKPLDIIVRRYILGVVEVGRMSSTNLPQGIEVMEPTPSNQRWEVIVAGRHAQAKALRTALLDLDRSKDLGKSRIAVSVRCTEEMWEVLSGDLALAYRERVEADAQRPRPSRTTNPWVYLAPARERDEECRAALRALGATWDRERGEWKIREAKAAQAQALIDAANQRADEAYARRQAAVDAAFQRRAAEAAADPLTHVWPSRAYDEDLRVALRALGATWDRDGGAWLIRQSKADEARALVAAVDARHEEERERRIECETAAAAERRRGWREFHAGTGGWYGRTVQFTVGEVLAAEDGTHWVVEEATEWYVPEGESSAVGGHPTDEGGYAYHAWASPAPADVAERS